MAIKYKLPKELNALLIEAREALNEFVGEQRDEHNEKSDKWQEGEKGEAHDIWLGELEDLNSALDDYPEAAEE